MQKEDKKKQKQAEVIVITKTTKIKKKKKRIKKQIAEQCIKEHQFAFNDVWSTSLRLNNTQQITKQIKIEKPEQVSQKREDFLEKIKKNFEKLYEKEGVFSVSEFTPERISNTSRTVLISQIKKLADILAVTCADLKLFSLEKDNFNLSLGQQNENHKIQEIIAYLRSHPPVKDLFDNLDLRLLNEIQLQEVNQIREQNPIINYFFNLKDDKKKKKKKKKNKTKKSQENSISTADPEKMMDIYDENDDFDQEKSFEFIIKHLNKMEISYKRQPCYVHKEWIDKLEKKIQSDP